MKRYCGYVFRENPQSQHFNNCSYAGRFFISYTPQKFSPKVVEIYTTGCFFVGFFLGGGIFGTTQYLHAFSKLQQNKTISNLFFRCAVL